MRALLLLLVTALTTQAQIYADFTVSQGGTSLGTFRARLDYQQAPRTCANFIGLATGERPFINPVNGSIEQRPYYDGIIFHRLVHNFVIQGGSPQGTGSDGPGYTILDEFDPSLRHTGRYILSMAKTNFPNTGGSQFFITLAPTPNLDDRHSVFGEVVDVAPFENGRALIDSFTDSTQFPTGAGDRPTTPIVMDSVEIVRVGPEAEAFDINDPSLSLPEIVQSKVEVTSAEGMTADNGGSLTIEIEARDRHTYNVFGSTDLQSWTDFRTIHLFEEQLELPFAIDGTGDRFFVRLPAVSYVSNPDAPLTLTANGNQLRLFPATGGTVTLTFDGSDGGTWTDSDGNSGTLSEVGYFDAAENSGSLTLEQDQAFRYSLGQLSCTFSAGAGSKGYMRFRNLNLGFHTPAGGYADNGVNAPLSNSARISPRFEFVPAP